VSTKGRLLVATPLLGDPNFERTVVLMLEHSDEGALGVVLNRPSTLEVADPMADWARLAAVPPLVFIGGPVSKGSVIGLARRSGELPDESFTAVVGAVGVIDLALDSDEVGGALDAVRVFTGYAGWAPEQLEGEIDEGAWWTVDAQPDDAMTAEPSGLWRAVLARQPYPLRMWSNYPDSPSLN
jgi:putative transcriptional regulator